MNKKYKKAFTLIELIIVIAIIGMISSIALFSLRSAQQSGRNAKRRADLESIKAAMELYYNDCGEYPPEQSRQLPSSIHSGLASTPNVNCPSSPTNVYMTETPTDPSNGGMYNYYRANDDVYYICAHIEGSTDPRPGNCRRNCGIGDCNYRVSGI